MEDEQEACHQRNEPPLCKGRDGGVEPPAREAPGAVEDSTSPDPS